MRRFADKSDVSAVGIVRLTGTELKGFLYALSAVITKDPEKTYKSPLNVVLKRVSVIRGLPYARSFFEAVQDWEKMEIDPERMREAFFIGMKALEAIESWQMKEAVDETKSTAEKG